MPTPKLSPEEKERRKTERAAAKTVNVKIPAAAGLSMKDVSQPTSTTVPGTNNPNPPQVETEENKAPEPEAPKTANPPAPRQPATDPTARKALDEMEARLRKERPEIFAQAGAGRKGAKNAIEIPIDFDDENLEWTIYKGIQHMFRIAVATRGGKKGWYAKPESFKGDVRFITDKMELEYFATWPNKG